MRWEGSGRPRKGMGEGGPGGAAGSICWPIALSVFVLQGLMRDESFCGYGARLVINVSQNSHSLYFF